LHEGILQVIQTSFAQTGAEFIWRVKSNVSSLQSVYFEYIRGSRCYLYENICWC